jgi:hypothetical protein
MGRKLLILGISGVWLASCAAGCRSGPSGPPSDPIFVTRRPIISRPSASSPLSSARADTEPAADNSATQVARGLAP